MKILTVVGARPQFIKAAALSREIQKQGRLDEIIVHTGQHYDENMSEIFFKELGIPTPDYNLAVGSASHGAQTGKMLHLLDEVLIKEKPALMLVYGDTNSTLAGALSAKKLCIPVAHIEAGLRSHNEYQPEEINRKLTDHISNLLFSTSERAVKQLKHEGVDAAAIHNVGDIMYDSVLYARKHVDSQPILKRYGLSNKSFVLTTLHRAENTDDRQRLYAILDALCLLALKLSVVMPIHPRTEDALKQDGKFEYYSAKLQFIEPLGFFDMVALTQSAKMLATDSGGLQKESFYAGVACVVLRDETEWSELIDIKANRLLPPTTTQEIYDGLLTWLDTSLSVEQSPYGEGDAANLIHNILCQYLLRS